MPPEKAPAFQFYPKDFLMDVNVAEMTLAERGAYITLLCMCWQEGSLSTEPARLARLLKVPVGAFGRLWPALEPCFRVVDGRLVQPRIERERRKQETYRAMKVEAGRQGGIQKAAAKQTPSRTPSRRLAKASPPSSSSSSSSSSVSDLQTSVKEQEQETRFARFWAVYPNKKAKGDAWKAWEKRQPDEALTDRIVAAVARQKLWPGWTKDGGQFIPHPATWLNRGSWDDEPAGTSLGLVSERTRQNIANSEEALRLIQQGDL